MTDMRATERLLVGKRYERRIRLVDQHMYAAWRLSEDRRTFKAMVDTGTILARALTETARSICETARRLMPLVEEARREIAVQDAIARRQEFEA